MGSFPRTQFEQVLSAWLSEHRPGGRDGHTARAYLEQGRALLILDGVDEVPRSHGEGVAAWHPRALFSHASTQAGIQLLLKLIDSLRPDALM